MPPVGKVTEFLEYVFLTEAQKKQMEDNADLIQEECISENADNSTEDPIEGGPDGDGDEDPTGNIISASNSCLPLFYSVIMLKDLPLAKRYGFLLQ